MTDIVERLRMQGIDTDMADTAREAANEIERLRERVEMVMSINHQQGDKIERLRGIIYRNCDASEAAILSSDEDAAVIRKICSDESLYK